ncbi:MAG: AIR carboxylase family protein [Oligoflexia bacterium]|nr:AIR carboxylase family protein [Oligoflexia bacterium]
MSKQQIGFLSNLTLAGLKKIHSGKVRESFRLDDERRLIVSTDRISAFDRKLNHLVFHKGAILNSLSAFWFSKTKEIVDNHFISLVDPNAMIVKEVTPIPLEIIVRGHLTGSLWRSYTQEGRRDFDGTKLPNNLERFQALPEAIVTITTKGIRDEEISSKDIVAQNILTSDHLHKIKSLALKLFSFGQTILKQRGLILVDSKYEFGFNCEGKLLLIDEIHTPDSSRIWDLEHYLHTKESVEEHSLDKEYLRNILRQQQEADASHFEELSNRYLKAYTRITGENLEDNIPKIPLPTRLHQNLPCTPQGFVAIVMGSKSDIEHGMKIKKVLEQYDVKAELRVVSAHKNGEEVSELANNYNFMLGPVAIIAVAGKSNALGGALAMNLNHPVINCPLFSDKLDLILNINSSLIMPSKTPIATTIDPESAALLALRSLQLPALRSKFQEESLKLKRELKQQDQEVREI